MLDENDDNEVPVQVTLCKLTFKVLFQNLHDNFKTPQYKQ